MDHLIKIRQQLSILYDTAMKDIEKATSMKQIIDLKVLFLGKKSQLQQIKIKIIENNLQKDIFKYFQETIDGISTLIENKILEISSQIEKVNIGLPIYNNMGSIHPITITKNQIKSILLQKGFMEFQHREIDSPNNCFDKLNIHKNHPCRNDFQSFFLEDEKMLTPHTSNAQVHLLQLKLNQYKHFTVGKVYRRDSDATHTPMFHQLEVLYIDKHINLKYMVNFIKDFLNTFFQSKLKIRFRPSYFPFTEPSVEVDIWNETNEAWLEVAGAGLVSHNVLKLNEHQDTPGFAFGFGIERLAMIKYNIDDIRKLYSPLPFINTNISNTGAY